MGFTLDSIRNKTPDSAVLTKGRRIAEDGLAVLSEVISAWKGEAEIKGIVTADADGEKSQGTETRLVVSDGNIKAFSCKSCGSPKNGMCVHACATAFTYYRSLYQNTAMRTSTSAVMKSTMDAYVKHGIAYVMRKEEGSVTLVPKLSFAGGIPGMEFRLGNDRQEYVIADLAEFHERMKKEEVTEYGKHLTFKHTLWSFDTYSRKLAELLLAAIEQEISVYQSYNQGRSRDSFKQRDLKLSRSYMTEILEFLDGNAVEVEFEDKTKGNVIIRKENPHLSLRVRETLLGGYSIELKEPVTAFMGSDRLFVCTDSAFYICDKEYTESMGLLIPKMSRALYREEDFAISRRDMPIFCGHVLPVIKRYMEVDTGRLSIEEFQPQKVEAGFRFDMGENNEVICEETLSYGDFQFNPLKGGSVPVGICRDYPQEYRLKNMIEEYFGTPPDDSGRFIVKTEGEIYRLLEEGIPLFMEAGNVYVSESFKSMRVVAPPRVAVGARISSNNMLELDIDFDNFDRSELKGLLESYRLRKKYYRLKNGDFVRLEDNSLAVISELADSFGLEGEADVLAGKSIAIPKYRALYLETLLNRDSEIHFNRDRSLRQLIREMKEMADSDYEVPESLKDILRKYQRTGYRWLKTLSENGFGGILADDMGLGKTLQIITLLLADKEKNTDNRLDKPALIVCPASLVYNWENEIRRFAPSLSALVISGTADEREHLIANNRDKEVLITSYDSLRRDLNCYLELEFSYQVIDEAQFIKNPATQTAKSVKDIKADARFALTGTPIENRLGELWSIFDYLMPGFLYTYTKFRSDLENPIVRDGDRIALKRLQDMIRPFVLRRLKKDVLRDLPEKQETVVYSKMEGEQLKLYRANVAQFKEDLLGMSREDFAAKRMHVLARLMRLRQICCDPSLCYEDFTDNSAKLDTCIELVKDAVEAGHKILLFSQFTSMLERIAKRLAEEEISFFTLTGDVPKEKRVKLAEEFNSDDTQVFLISLKAGGTGLNLTGADIVIHYDPWWNAAVMNQATDRAHRIGQQHRVNVYSLIAKDSIEEKILKLQEDKKDLAEQVVSEDVARLSSFSKEELLKLLDA